MSSFDTVPFFQGAKVTSLTADTDGEEEMCSTANADLKWAHTSLKAERSLVPVCSALPWLLSIRKHPFVFPRLLSRNWKSCQRDVTMNFISIQPAMTHYCIQTNHSTVVNTSPQTLLLQRTDNFELQKVSYVHGRWIRRQSSIHSRGNP